MGPAGKTDRKGYPGQNVVTIALSLRRQFNTLTTLPRCGAVQSLLTQPTLLSVAGGWMPPKHSVH